MQVIDPKVYNMTRKKRRRKSRLLRVLAGSGALLIALYVGIASFRYLRPLPDLQAESKSVIVEPGNIALNFPSGSQAAVGAIDYGLLANVGGDEPRPIASVSKVVTALTVLDKKPLSKGQTGPVLTLGADDVALYNEYISKDGSVVKVAVGEQISQYQALQAVLLPSANNMADSMARWAFGSVDEYVTAANTFVASNGLSKTKIADASGFSPQTVSTATDVIKLGELAMNNEVVSEIVSQSEVTIPVAGKITNVNNLLGQNGIDGIKTGNTDEAGGCFLTTAEIRLDNGNRVRVLVTVLGAPTRPQALADAQKLLVSAKQNFITETLPAGTTVGYYTQPWGGRVAAKTSKDLQFTRWVGQRLRADISLKPASTNATTDVSIGKLNIKSGAIVSSVDVTLSEQITQPSRTWRFWQAVTP